MKHKKAREPEIEITRLSSKGQVVIPKKARDELNLEPSAKFIVYWKDDTIYLKKISLRYTK